MRTFQLTEAEKDLIVERLLGPCRPTPQFHLWNWRETGRLKVRYVLVGEIETLSWIDAAILTGVRKVDAPRVVKPGRRGIETEAAMVRRAVAGGRR